MLGKNVYNPPLRDIAIYPWAGAGFPDDWFEGIIVGKTRPYETLLNCGTFADNHSTRNFSIANSLNLASTSIQGA